MLNFYFYLNLSNFQPLENLDTIAKLNTLKIVLLNYQGQGFKGKIETFPELYSIVLKVFNKRNNSNFK